MIDDSPPAAALVRRRLSEVEADWSPYVTSWSPDMDAARRALVESAWDVVILDLGLPGYEDLEALEELHGAHPELPIVVLTARDDRALASRALIAGAQDYIVKRQLDTATLERAVRHAIERHHVLRELSHAVQEARESEARLRQLTSRSSDGIVVITDDRRVVFANPAARELLDATFEEGLGHEPRETNLVSELLGVEPVLVVGDRTLDVRTVAVDWHGRRASMALVRDVSEARRAQELRSRLARSERMAAVGELAASVAHEINNPMTYVCTSVDLILRQLDLVERGVRPTIDMAQLRELATSARDGATRVVDIIRELSIFARAEETTAARPVDVASAVRAALAIAHHQLRHQATIEQDFDAVAPVLGSEGRLAQVFLNLLVNAGHALDDGTVREKRIAVRVAEVGDEIVVTVRDNGRGIAREHLDRIFDPDFTTKPRGEGSGLGLAISREIVTEHGGAIAVESELGVGTAVHVAIPAFRGSGEPTPSAPAPPSVVPPARGRVLLVDDEPAIRSALGALLRDYYVTEVADSVATATAMIRRDAAFDVILCDIVMPGASGLDLYRWIETERPALASRCLFLTGGGTTAEMRAFLARERERVISKPVDTRRLLERINALVAPRDDD